jgi:hypothetical protein
VSTYLKGWGPFIARRQLDNYNLIIFYILDGIYMTSGSSLEIVIWPRLVGGFHGVQAYSRVFQAPSPHSLGPLWQ